MRPPPESTSVVSAVCVYGSRLFRPACGGFIEVTTRFCTCCLMAITACLRRGSRLPCAGTVACVRQRSPSVRPMQTALTARVCPDAFNVTDSPSREKGGRLRESLRGGRECDRMARVMCERCDGNDIGDNDIGVVDVGTMTCQRAHYGRRGQTYLCVCVVGDWVFWRCLGDLEGLQSVSQPVRQCQGSENTLLYVGDVCW